MKSSEQSPDIKNGWITDEWGDRRHYVDDKKHSINDEPAVIWTNGNQFWFRSGKNHRDGGKPAYVGFTGYLGFYENGISLKTCECGQFAKKHCPTRKAKE